METQLQRNRYELKYIVNEACAHEIRDFARNYLAPDSHADASANYAYTIFSIYLDNPQFDLFNATIRGHKNRFKLRLRYYDEKPESSVFFEIKRRMNGVILKERAHVRREATNRLIAGGRAEPFDLVNGEDDRAFGTLRRFCDLRDKIDAECRLIVAYTREAWVTPDNNSARLTFDRKLEGAPFNPSSPIWRTDPWFKAEAGGVVLELKFTDRCPNWMRDLVRIFNLHRCSLAKYVKCLNQMNRMPEYQTRPQQVVLPATPHPSPARRTGGKPLMLPISASLGAAAPGIAT